MFAYLTTAAAVACNIGACVWASHKEDPVVCCHERRFTQRPNARAWSVSDYFRPTWPQCISIYLVSYSSPKSLCCANTHALHVSCIHTPHGPTNSTTTTGWSARTTSP